jgi:hypothetical protein
MGLPQYFKAKPEDDIAKGRAEVRAWCKTQGKILSYHQLFKRSALTKILKLIVGSWFCNEIEAFARSKPGERIHISLARERDMVIRPKQIACLQKYAEYYQKIGEVQAERRLRGLIKPPPAVSQHR